MIDRSRHIFLSLSVALAMTLVLAPTQRAASAPAADAASMAVTVELPRLRVSEYHPPYVAVWIQDGEAQVAANLAVWYQLDQQGKKWLKDMRLWWRRTGRSLEMPVDGVAGATRRPGTHDLTFDATRPPLADLAPGDYTLFVEAARENGGREVVSIDFAWPPASSITETAQGERELGTVRLVLSP